MKFKKRLSLIALAIMLLAPAAPSINKLMPYVTVHANSQTNKLPKKMRNMWYGHMDTAGFKRLKLYGNPTVYNGYNYLHITYIKRHGHIYDLHVPNADSLEVWYSHNHLRGVVAGTGFFNLYTHNKKYRWVKRTKRYVTYKMRFKKITPRFKRSNNENDLEDGGYITYYPHEHTVYSYFDPTSTDAVVPKNIKVTSWTNQSNRKHLKSYFYSKRAHHWLTRNDKPEYKYKHYYVKEYY